MQARVPPKLPRILLVEDDTISQAYFRAVLEALPTDVDAVTTHACAVARAGAERHDLWLVDLTLPDGSGIELLRELRKRWPQPPPALAHTADADPALRAPALQAGFLDVLVKPLTTADLATAVRGALAGPGTPARPGASAGHGTPAGRLPDWDHAAAAAALNHDPANVQALRKLFLAELADARQQVLDHIRDGDQAALRFRLHRLQASCGLVGACRLGAAVDQLQHAPGSRTALEDFIHAAHDLLH
ncbi:MAG: response regulator [Proteobacteria bacterium]|nr:response regulator [Pseudomonadota bacterium]